MLIDVPIKRIEATPHPETLEGEVFIGNFDPLTFDYLRWKTKRAGYVAYQKNGRTILDIVSKGILVPTFVMEQELLDDGYTLIRVTPS